MKFNSSNLYSGMSERTDGAMNLKFTNQGEQNLDNRKLYFSKLGLNYNNLVSTDLVHGNNVEIVRVGDQGKIIKSTDGLITNNRNILLATTFADCLPIYFHDPVNEAVGLAHAGWRGVKTEIVNRMIDNLKENFNSDPMMIKVHIGPHLQKCHFEVKTDVASEFQNYQEFIIRGEDKIFVDLLGIAKRQLTNSGVSPANISESKTCTYEEEAKYFSFRRDKPLNIESMIAYVGIK